MSHFPWLPFQVVQIQGTQLYSDWKKLNAQWRREGCSAVILGDHDHMLRHESNFEMDARSTEEILAAAKNINYFEKRLESWPTFLDDVKDGEWPKDEPSASPAGALENSFNSPDKLEWVARIPTAQSYEIPAWLRWGNHNDCPSPEEHVAVLRHWNEKYGLEIFFMTDESVSYILGHPPTDRAAALALAREHILYCSEGLDGLEMSGGLGVQARQLIDTRLWYFWWD